MLIDDKVRNSDNVIKLNNGVSLAFIDAIEKQNKPGKSAVSVTVSKGHFDAVDFPEGFAHLYEHLLFSASTKYENSDALDKHLFKFHGQVNGWTQDTMTNFQLSCDEDGVLQACDILFDRLSSPLFELSDIAKEITAIDAEFRSQKSNSVRQLLSVQKATCNQQHPFAKFTSGNKKTLSMLGQEFDDNKTLTTAQLLSIQQKLKEYHRITMNGHHINICIGLWKRDEENQKNETLKHKLKAIIENKFTKHDTPVDDLNLPALYNSEHLANFIQIKQDKSQHQLIVSFTIIKSPDYEFSLYRDALFIVICHLLESKHQGGLFSSLTSLNMANDVQSYYKSLDKHTDEIVISLQLSEHGAKHSQLVFMVVQSYINYVKHHGIEPWRFREKGLQYSLSTNIQTKAGLLEQCIDMSQQMANLNPSVSSIECAFNHEHIHAILPKVLSQLTPLHARVYFISPLTKTDCKTPHYNTEYFVERLAAPKKLQQQLQNASPNLCFSMPRQNPYMSNEHPIVKRQKHCGSVMEFTAQQICFKFYQHTEFGLPNGECYISISEPHMFQTEKQIAIKRVWLACLNEHLQSEFFDVELAGVHFRVYPHQHGVTIHTGGFSERQILLCIELVNAVRSFKANESTISRHLDKQLAQISNKPKQRPLNQLFAKLNDYYQASAYSLQSINQTMQNITVEDVTQLQQKYFAHNFIECLLLGNWQVTSAERFFQQLKSRFTALEGVEKPKPIVIDVKSGEHLHQQTNTSKENCLVWHYIPVINEAELSLANNEKTLTQRLSARSFVLEKLLSHTIFNVIRQKYKMAYSLGVGYKPIGVHPGIAIYVESPSHSLIDIHRALLETIEQGITLFDEEDKLLESIKKELINQVKPHERDISQTANRVWLHFEDNNPILSYRELIDAIEDLKLQEIKQALNTLLHSYLGQVLLTHSNNTAPIIEGFTHANR